MTVKSAIPGSAFFSYLVSNQKHFLTSPVYRSNNRGILLCFLAHKKRGSKSPFILVNRVTDYLQAFGKYLASIVVPAAAAVHSHSTDPAVLSSARGKPPIVGTKFSATAVPSAGIPAVPASNVT